MVGVSAGLREHTAAVREVRGGKKQRVWDDDIGVQADDIQSALPERCGLSQALRGSLEPTISCLDYSIWPCKDWDTKVTHD